MLPRLNSNVKLFLLTFPEFLLYNSMHRILLAMTETTAWEKPKIVTTPVVIQAKSGKVINYLRQVVAELRPTNESLKLVPHVELDSATTDEARKRLAALYSARTRLRQDDKQTFDQLKIKLQGTKILIWLQKTKTFSGSALHHYRTKRRQ
jgi:hypothetical protein